MEIELYREPQMSKRVPIIIFSIVVALMAILVVVSTGLEISLKSNQKQVEARVIDVYEYYRDKEDENGNTKRITYQKVSVEYTIDGELYNADMTCEDTHYMVEERIIVYYDARTPNIVSSTKPSYLPLILIGAFIGVIFAVVLVVQIKEVKNENRKSILGEYDPRELLTTGDKILGQVGIVNKKYAPDNKHLVVAIQAICFKVEHGKKNVDWDYSSEWIKPLNVDINGYYVDIYTDKKVPHLGYVDLESLRKTP